jgi:hypothetical protein
MTSQITTGVYQNSEMCVAISCNGDYTTLSAYNSTPGQFSAGPPLPSQTAVQATVIVPSYGGVGYSILQNNLAFNQLSSSGYFNVNNAYPSYGNNCQAYTTALAGSGGGS